MMMEHNRREMLTYIYIHVCFSINEAEVVVVFQHHGQRHVSARRTASYFSTTESVMFQNHGQRRGLAEP